MSDYNGQEPGWAVLAVLAVTVLVALVFVVAGILYLLSL